jgi:hypothetical protein
MSTGKPQLDQFYGNLESYVQMVTNDYSNLLMLDAAGGLGKTHNVLKTLESEFVDDGMWLHQKGFTTPLELYKTLWKARRDNMVLFLDDMSGVTNKTKAIDMLKAATDTQGEENIVEYRTSQSIDHPYDPMDSLPSTFTFRGSIIMSFNDTPDNRHFDALKDRGTYYNLSLSYDERISLITEIAKIDSFSDLDRDEQIETAEWIDTVTDPSFNVTIRTFEEVCKMREFGQDMNQNWQKMALEIFDIDYEKYRILEMRRNDDMSVEKQIEVWTDEFDKSRSTYYNTWDLIRHEKGL